MGLEVNLDRKKRTLYNCQRIENYADTYDAHYRAKLWRIIEICNKRGRNVQYKVKQATDDNIEIEYSVVVSLSPILFTYQCLRKAAVNQRLRHSNENGQHTDDSIIMRCKQPCHHNHNQELYALNGKALDCAPKYTFGCFLF